MLIISNNPDKDTSETKEDTSETHQDADPTYNEKDPDHNKSKPEAKPNQLGLFLKDFSELFAQGLKQFQNVGDEDALDPAEIDEDLSLEDITEDNADDILDQMQGLFKQLGLEEFVETMREDPDKLLKFSESFENFSADGDPQKLIDLFQKVQQEVDDTVKEKIDPYTDEENPANLLSLSDITESILGEEAGSDGKPRVNVNDIADLLANLLNTQAKEDSDEDLREVLVENKLDQAEQTEGLSPDDQNTVNQLGQTINSLFESMGGFENVLKAVTESLGSGMFNLDSIPFESDTEIEVEEVDLEDDLEDEVTPSEHLDFDEIDFSQISLEHEDQEEGVEEHEIVDINPITLRRLRNLLTFPQKIAIRSVASTLGITEAQIALLLKQHHDQFPNVKIVNGNIIKE